MNSTLDESEKCFRWIAERVPIGILIGYGADQPWEFANSSICRLAACAREELLHISASELFSKEIYFKLRRFTELISSGQSAEESYQAALVRRDGSTHPIELATTIIKWRGIPAVLFLISDISAPKNMDKMIEGASEWEGVARGLEAKQNELAAHKKNLDKVNKQLMKTNSALSVLARNIDQRRDELVKRITTVVSSKVTPLLEEIKSENLPIRVLSKLDIISALLSDLTGEKTKAHEIIVSLSPTELHVAVLVKDGLKSEQIAMALHTSLHTIKTHRRNIRKKLKLQNAEVNLISYLRSRLAGTINMQNSENKPGHARMRPYS